MLVNQKLMQFDGNNKSMSSTSIQRSQNIPSAKLGQQQ